MRAVPRHPAWHHRAGRVPAAVCGLATITALNADQAQLHGVLAGLRDIGAVITELRATDAPISAAKPSQTSTCPSP